MTLHETLPIFIALFGIFVGVYMLTKVKKLGQDKILIFDFMCLSLVNLYVGGIYLLFVMGAISSVETLSPLIRPANLLQIILPAVITWRMGMK